MYALGYMVRRVRLKDTGSIKKNMEVEIGETKQEHRLDF